MLCSMWTPSLMLLGIKILLQTHCINDLMLAGHVRLVMQKKTNCTGYVEQTEYFLIPFWTCWALAEDDTCTSLANTHIRFLPAWKSQLELLHISSIWAKVKHKNPTEVMTEGILFFPFKLWESCPQQDFTWSSLTWTNLNLFHGLKTRALLMLHGITAEWKQGPDHWHLNQSPTHQPTVWHPKSKGCCFCTKQSLNKCIYFAQVPQSCSILYDNYHSLHFLMEN